jgi:hypothetical protein
MGIQELVRRTSEQVDTSGALPPVLTSLRLESGVYVGSDTGSAADNMNSILQGRISLGIIAAFIVGAFGFYYYTRSIQGGG